VNDAGPIRRIEDVAEVLEEEAGITSAIRDASQRLRAAVG